MDFDQAFERVIGHEQGYQCDPDDSGNWTGGRVDSGALLGTKYGISAAAYPGEDIRNITLDRARALYRRDYWVPAGCDQVPDALRFELFDAAVNAGVRAAIRMLQVAAGADADGVLGPQTLRRVAMMDPAAALRRLQGARLDAYTRAKAWPTFGAGWVRRVARNMMEVA